MTYSLSHLPKTNNGQIPAIHCWTPVVAGGDSQEIRGALVIAHGMGEHALRYERLARALNDAGLVVHAIDHRGHGATVHESAQLGDFGPGGWNSLVDDLGLLVEKVRGEHPGLPVLLMGHSMGSMAVQHFLTKWSDRIDGAALSGTTAVDLMAEAVADPDQDVFSAMNSAFAPTRTDFDWLSRDEVEVDRYLDDPLCGFTVEGPSVESLAEAGRVYSRPDAIARIRRDLPIHLFAGELDPVGGNGALVRLVADRYREAGIERVTLRLYPEARHELFNETNRDEVTSEFLGWIESVL